MKATLSVLLFFKYGYGALLTYPTPKPSHKLLGKEDIF